MKYTLLITFMVPWHVTMANELKTAGEIDFPTIPAIMIPSVPGASPVQQTLENDLGDLLKPMSGVSVRPARCDAQGELINEYSISSIDANGKFKRVSSAGVFSINKDGSGSAVTNNAVYTSTGNGKGNIVTNDEVFENEGDWKGHYSGRYGVIEFDGKGSGSWVGDYLGVVKINADGSASWVGSDEGIDEGVIKINADGSGSWIGGPLGVVKNNGNGTGTITGKLVKMAPLSPVQPAGKFPPIDALNPPKLTCGYVITLSDQILFDFDKAELRDTVKPYLTVLSKAINNTQITTIEVRGHTDSKGSDDYNQVLSEKRANTVKNELVSLGPPNAVVAIGLGEKHPVAPNELNGNDNPTGRL